MSNFRSHPGGRVILSALGQTDSTDVFNAFHPGKTHELLADFYIGDLDTRAEAPCSSEIKTSPFEAEYRLLVGEMKASGLYKSECVFSREHTERSQTQRLCVPQGTRRVDAFSSYTPPLPSLQPIFLRI